MNMDPPEETKTDNKEETDNKVETEIELNATCETEYLLDGTKIITSTAPNGDQTVTRISPPILGRSRAETTHSDGSVTYNTVMTDDEDIITEVIAETPKPVSIKGMLIIAFIILVYILYRSGYMHTAPDKPESITSITCKPAEFVSSFAFS